MAVKKKYPKTFEQGQIFAWKTTKGMDVTAVITHFTECFIYLKRTIGERTDEIMFSPDSFKARLIDGTIEWKNDS